MSYATKARFACPDDIVKAFWKVYNQLPSELTESGLAKSPVVVIGRGSMIVHTVGGSAHEVEFAVSATANEYLKGKPLPEGVILRVGLPLQVTRGEEYKSEDGWKYVTTYLMPCEPLKAIHSRATVMFERDPHARMIHGEIEKFWASKRTAAPEAAEVKGWEEGSLSEAEVAFEKMCQSHDWHYQYSDDRRVQDNGDASWERLTTVRKELGDRGDMIFKFYSK